MTSSLPKVPPFVTFKCNAGSYDRRLSRLRAHRCEKIAPPRRLYQLVIVAALQLSRFRGWQIIHYHIPLPIDRYDMCITVFNGHVSTRFMFSKLNLLIFFVTFVGLSWIKLPPCLLIMQLSRRRQLKNIRTVLNLHYKRQLCFR